MCLIDSGSRAPLKHVLQQGKVKGLAEGSHEVVYVDDHNTVQLAIFSNVVEAATVKRMDLELSILDCLKDSAIPYPRCVGQSVAISDYLV